MATAKFIRFNDALRLAAKAAQDPTLPTEWPIRVVRDVYGRVRFAIDCDAGQYPPVARQRLEYPRIFLRFYWSGMRFWGIGYPNLATGHPFLPCGTAGCGTP